MPSQTAMILDIETRHDTDLMARHGYEAKAGAFVPVIYHLPCAVAIGSIDGEGQLTTVRSLGEGLLADDPCALSQECWELIGHAPVLVTFNGRGFDLPVLELCALRYGCMAGRYWQDQYGPRYRYSKVHFDLLDMLSNYGGASKGLTLSNVVQLLGYQGKEGMSGADVQASYHAGRVEEIRTYNRLDCIRTYAVWLQWARIAGRLTEHMYHAAALASKPFLDQIRGR